MPRNYRNHTYNIGMEDEGKNPPDKNKTDPIPYFSPPMIPVEKQRGLTNFDKKLIWGLFLLLTLPLVAWAAIVHFWVQAQNDPEGFVRCPAIFGILFLILLGTVGLPKLR